MVTQPFDPTTYKTAQRQEWDAAAPAWQRWGESVEEASRGVTQMLIDLAAVRPGYRVLDIASGTGEPALSLARQAGPTGRVIATDQSSRMLAVAQERAGALGLDNLEFVEIDAEALDFPAGSFDAATCRFGLMFLPDLDGALRRIYRSLRPGGWFAAAIWDVPPKVPMLSLAMGLATRMFEVPAPPPGVPTLFTLSQPGTLEQAFTSGGFTNVRCEAAQVVVEPRSAEEYVDFILETAAPIAAVMNRQSAEQQQQFRTALAAAAQQHADASGQIRMVNSAVCVAGQRGS